MTPTTRIVTIKPILLFTKIFYLVIHKNLLPTARSAHPKDANAPAEFHPPAEMAEGEGFEPPKVFSLSGFQDRRDRPLCHPSGLSHPFFSSNCWNDFYAARSTPIHT